jgi:hypothetical protein
MLSSYYGMPLNVKFTNNSHYTYSLVSTYSEPTYDYITAPLYKGFYSSTSTTPSRFRCVHFGTGTTPVTGDDFQMEAEITSGLTYVGMTGTSNTELGSITYNLTFKNSTGSDQLISEIGMTCYGYSSNIQTNINTSKNVTTGRVLLYHEVLDAPLTVLNGETFTVSITETFPMPIAE